MKTFKDLKFEPHQFDGLQARMYFPNGYGISVVRFKIMGSSGYGSYTSNDKEWEIAVIKGDKGGWGLCYDTPITDDVIGYLTARQVTSVMKQIQEL